MEGPEIEGPPIWLNLNRQAEEKLLGFCKNNNARLQWLDDYLAEAKAKLGVKCEEPTFVPKVSHFNSNLKTIHLTNFCFPYLFFAIIVLSLSLDSWQEQDQAQEGRQKNQG